MLYNYNKEIIKGLYLYDTHLLLDCNKYVYHNMLNGVELITLDKLNSILLWEFGYMENNSRCIDIKKVRSTLSSTELQKGNTTIYYLGGNDMYNVNGVVIVVIGTDIYVLESTNLLGVDTAIDLDNILIKCRLIDNMDSAEVRRYYLLMLLNNNTTMGYLALSRGCDKIYCDILGDSKLTRYLLFDYNNDILLLSLGVYKVVNEDLTYRLVKDLISSNVYIWVNNGLEDTYNKLHKLETKSKDLRDLGIMVQNRTISVVEEGNTILSLGETEILKECQSGYQSG